MCGRIATTLPPDAMARLFKAIPSNDLPAHENFNVCPTSQVSVISLMGGARRLSAMRWGFLPSWYKSERDGPLLINARAETIAEKPAFRAACRARRCLIPMDGFYEWFREGRARHPYYVTRADGTPLVCAGIWQDWGQDQRPTFAVVTTPAPLPLSQIHHRCPVVIERDHWGKWLGEEGHGAARLMVPPEPGLLKMHPVGQEVNSNRASGPALIEPIES
ncbi:SOS response-associated peptidase [Aliiroseovarius crassostreae]|uniref:SOS response-associated peptidase n=1 Tax=Aliiroseovarius crassostreae TaxID=154981 RepID=UPI00220727ED|nr:SOS response-associated peptidase [Aliiroseovarius crassostreae]UWQ02480.1 SOS response-associated peptidase [Aliiroseovarius crassostreae]